MPGEERDLLMQAAAEETRQQQESIMQNQAEIDYSSLDSSMGRNITDAQESIMDDYNYTDQEKFDAIQDNGSDPLSLATERQSFWDTTKNVVGGGLYKGGLTTIENIGYMMDVPGYFSRMMDGVDQGYTNFASEWASKQKSEYDEYNPILGNSMGADFAKGMQGVIDSAVGFAIPGAGASKFVGAGIKALGMTGKAAKITHALGSAVMTNYAESRMMADEIYGRQKKMMLDQGYSTEEANSVARKDMEDFMLANKLMALTDMVTFHSILKGKHNAADVIMGGGKQTKNEAIKDIGKGMLAEAGEEMYQGALDKEITESTAEEKAIHSTKESSNMLERAGEYIVTDGVTDGFWGAIGGPFQQYGTKGLSGTIDYANKKVEEKRFSKSKKFKEKEPPKPTSERPVYKAPVGHRQNRGDYSTVVKYTDEKGDRKVVTTKGFDEYVKKHESEWKEANKESVEEWDKYDSNKKAYDTKKEAWDKENKEAEKARNRASLNKATGKADQAIKDVAEFTEKDNALNEKYQEAIKNGDHSEIRDIEDERIENLFLRYAERGQTEDGKGSVDVLIKALNEAKEAGSKEAARYLEQIGDPDENTGMIGEYMKAYNRASKLSSNEGEARSIANDMFKNKMRVHNTGELIKSIDSDMSSAQAEVMDELAKEDPEGSSSLKANLLALETEKASLEIAASKDRRVTGSRAVSKKIDSLDKEINKAKKELIDANEKMPSKSDSESGKKLEKLAKEKANALYAHNLYKDRYNNAENGVAYKTRKESAYEIMKQRIEDSNNLEDLHTNKAILEALPVSRFYKGDRIKLNKMVLERNDFFREESKEAERKEIELDRAVSKVTQTKENMKSDLEKINSELQEKLDALSDIESYVSKGIRLTRKRTKRQAEKEKKRILKQKGKVSDQLEAEVAELNERSSKFESSLAKVEENLQKKVEEKAKFAVDSMGDVDPFLKNAVMKSLMGNDNFTADELHALAKAPNISEEEAYSMNSIADSLKAAEKEVQKTKVKQTNIPKQELTEQGEEIIGKVEVETQGRKDDIDIVGVSKQNDKNEAEFQSKNKLKMERHMSTSFEPDNDSNAGISIWIEENKDNKLGKKLKYKIKNITDSRGKFLIEALEKAVGDKKKAKEIFNLISNKKIKEIEALPNDLRTIAINHFPLQLNALGDDGKTIEVADNRKQTHRSVVTSAPYAIKDGQSGESIDTAIQQRLDVIKALINGENVISKIDQVWRGKMDRELTDDHSNTIEALGIKPEEAEIVIRTEEGFHDGYDVVDPDYFSLDSGGTKGFAYLKTTDPAGNPVGIRLAPGRLGREKAETLYRLLELKAKNVDFSKDISDIKDSGIDGISGMDLNQVFDLLVYSGSDSLDKGFPFHVDRTKKSNHTLKMKGYEKGIAFTKKSLEKRKEQIIETLSNYPLPSDTGMINNKEPFSDDVMWFGEKFDYGQHGNEFLFKNGYLGSHNAFAQKGNSKYGRPFNNGSLIISDPVIGEGDKKVVPTEKEKKAVDKKETKIKIKSPDQIKADNNKVFSKAFDVLGRTSDSERFIKILEGMAEYARRTEIDGSEMSKEELSKKIIEISDNVISDSAIPKAKKRMSDLLGREFKSNEVVKESKTKLFKDKPEVIDAIFDKKGVSYVDEVTRKEC